MNTVAMLSSRIKPFTGCSSSSSSKVSRTAICRGLKENVAALPTIEGIQQIVLQPLGHTIPNAEGKKASVAIYAHLAQKYSGSLSAAAAQEGLALYDEVVADAKARPGAHPNIDILFEVLAKPELQISIQVDKQ